MAYIGLISNAVYFAEHRASGPPMDRYALLCPGAKGEKIHPVPGGQQLSVRDLVDQRSVRIRPGPGKLGPCAGRPGSPVGALIDDPARLGIAHAVHIGHVVHRRAQVILPHLTELRVQQDDPVVIGTGFIGPKAHHTAPSGDRLPHKVSVSGPAECIVCPG